MTASPSSTRAAPRSTVWSLGAVLAEREIDDSTVLLLVRGDCGPAGAIGLRGRLHELSRAGFTTLVVDFGDGASVGESLLAVLLSTAGRLAGHGAELLVLAERPETEWTVFRAGLRLADPSVAD